MHIHQVVPAGTQASFRQLTRDSRSVDGKVALHPREVFLLSIQIGY